MWKATLIVCVLGLVLAGCSDDDGGTMAEGFENVGTIGEESVSDLDSSSIVGEWDIFGDTMTFNADHTVDGEAEGPDETATWAIQGNLLILDYTESYTYTDEEGNQVTGSESGRWATTAAIVDGELYMEEVMVRTQGSGSSLDGTWEFFEGEMETEQEDGYIVNWLESWHVEIVITGDTFTSVLIESWEVTGDVPAGWEDENGSDVEECAGTVAMREGMVVLTPTSGECGELEMERVADDVLVIEGEEYSEPVIMPTPDPLPETEPEPMPLEPTPEPDLMPEPML